MNTLLTIVTILALLGMAFIIITGIVLCIMIVYLLISEDTPIDYPYDED
jgi:hypothetical protein